jgi:hypothetical protein
MEAVEISFLVFIAFPVALFFQILVFPRLDGKLMPALFAGIISYFVFYLVRHSYQINSVSRE